MPLDTSALSELVYVALQLQADRVEPEVYRDILRDLIKILADVEEHVTQEEARVHWEWDEDPTVKLASAPNGVGAEDLQRIVADVRSGFEGMSETTTGRVVWPASFGSKAKSATKSIVRQLKRLESITVDTVGAEPLTLDRAFILEEVGRKTGWQEVGSVDGTLELISVRSRPHFSLREHGTGRRIRCSFPDAIFPIVRDSLGQRVVVEGRLTFREDGTPTSIASVTSVWARPEPTRSMTSLVGAAPNFTGGVSSGEYVRRMRDEDGGD